MTPRTLRFRIATAALAVLGILLTGETAFARSSGRGGSAVAFGLTEDQRLIRFRIREMIAQEDPEDILSDDAIVERLRKEGVDIARRTVAKYREALRIPSSVQRKREKAVPA